MIALVNAEAATRAAADTQQATNLSSLLANVDVSAIDSISELLAEMALLSAEDQTLAALIASQGAAIVVLQGIVAELLDDST